MKKTKLTKKVKPVTNRKSLVQDSQISDLSSQSTMPQPAGFPSIHFQSNQNSFQSTINSYPVPAESTFPGHQPNSSMPEEPDLPDISVNPTYQIPNPSVEEDDLPDISSVPISQGFYNPTKVPFPNIETAESTFLSNDSSIVHDKANLLDQNQDFDIPDISGSSQNPISNVENYAYNNSYEPQQLAPVELSIDPSINHANGNWQFENASGPEDIKEEAEKNKEEVEEIKIEPKEVEEVVKNKRVIIDLPLTMKCEYCEYERFESDFFPMHFGPEKEVLCKMCWNSRVASVKKEKIEILNECGTCEEWKHRYFGEKICPNNCIVCEDCQYRYIFMCKIQKRQDESCVFCNRALIKKEQPWTLVA
ncbi:unnamed protein product [Blepharisma stoltei]|uniref:Uncharacterized protein n=1 Tax=Blepharisma stoltei TaxID=1481888 RepID=A0AAU9JJS6_9CILI|nr:unnamed protein product [Blepharisma stoltei]